MFEKFAECFGRNREHFVIDRDRNTGLASAHAESGTKRYRVLELVFGNQALQTFYDLTRTFQVARAADTYCDFYNNNPLCILRVENGFFNVKQSITNPSYIIVIILTKKCINCNY